MSSEAAQAATRVLLVEDYWPQVVAVRAQIARFPEIRVELEHVDSLPAALARLAAGGLDLVLLDPGLPGTEGLQSLQVIRSSFPAVPVVVLTASDDRTRSRNAMELGAKDYLVKGAVDVGVLRRTILLNARRIVSSGAP